MRSNSFFILGNPRSGTTLLRLMLNAHPEIIVPPECGFIQWWYDKYKDWNLQNNHPDKVSEFIEDLKSSKKIETWQLNYNNLFQEILNQKPSNYAELCSLVYISYASNIKNKKTQYWGDKNNYYINHIELIYSIFPKAKYIMIIRDGRDVACSYKQIQNIKTNSKYKPNLPVNIEEIAKEWMQNNNKILSFFKNKTKQLHIVKYEDLIKTPTDKLSDICSFLEINYHPNMLNYYQEKNEPQEFLAWKEKTSQKPDINNVGKYKCQLTEKEIDKFQNIASQMLKAFDYTTNDEPKS